jgi:homoserine dehydrogenase
METTNIAILGLGNVGTGVARLLMEHSDRIARHAGRKLCLKKAVVRDLRKARGCTLPTGVLTNDLNEVIDDPKIKVVAQLLGGTEPARTIMLRLLESGKDVVTANKALLAEHGAELFDRARELGRSIAFEASVAGGVPIIANIAQCLSANQLQSLDGILNGTSNFILSKMHDDGTEYSFAVSEAQRLGYAEADPTLDVDGTDAAQKLAILAHLGFGARVHWSEIPRVGIDTVDVMDVHFAKQMGYRIKLLAVAYLVKEGLELHVSPTLVRHSRPLADIGGALNAIRVVGDAVGEVMYVGLGAGQMPTASAVVSDLIDTAVGRAAITFRTLELWSNRKARVKPSDYAKATGRFYLRVNVEDHPGVLAQISNLLGQHEISIASVLQQELVTDSDMVPLVIMTHGTTEGATRKACAEINKLACIRGKIVRLWLRD